MEVMDKMTHHPVIFFFFNLNVNVGRGYHLSNKPGGVT